MPKSYSIFFLVGLLLISLNACGRWYQAFCWPSEETELLLRDAMAGNGPSHFKVGTPEPSQKEIRFQIHDREYTGELYQPGEPSQAALLFLPGTTTAGKNDPRMVAFAKSLARAKFTVLIPDLKNLKALKITPGEIQEIADSFEYLSGKTDWAPQGRAGMVAVSYIVGPTILAAMESRIQNKVKFILSIGGYYDLKRLINYVTTGQYQNEQGQWTYLEPNAHGKWVLILSNTDRLTNAADRQILQEIARIKIANPEAPIADLSAKLVSTEGQALIALMNNRDPEKTPGLIAALPSSVQGDLEALSLNNKDFSQLKARVYLVHGYEDSLIPYPESLDLDKYLPSEHTLHLVHGLEHVEFKGDLGWFDAWSMACVTNQLLSERTR